MEKRSLGRGLSALMADMRVEPPTERDGAPTSAPDRMVPVDMLRPNPRQPRRDFDESALAELADSLKQKGVIQPLIVRPHPSSAGFEIVAGERRWRAAQLAQIHDVPVIVREFNDTEVLEVAIIENIQRADLNAIEEALGYHQLMDRFGHTQEQVASALSRSRSYIANLLRLLNLPDDVQGMVRSGQLTAGHARALITTDNPSELARQVAMRGLSVRETEKLARGDGPTRSGSAGRSRGAGSEKDADTRALEGDLSAALSMAVTINHEPGGEAGQLVIRYNSLEDLDLLCQGLSVLRRDILGSA